jgi:hypothetical protein
MPQVRAAAPAGLLALVIALAALWHSASAAGQAAVTPPSTVADAQARLQANDAAGAIAILEALTAREPADPSAWETLGNAYQAARDPDRALAAYRRELTLQPDSPQAYFSLGTTYAMKGDKDAAFAWLAKARASRQVDMSQLDADANLAPLRADPRIASLRPTDRDFADPFVEPVAILREWRGESANDQFGWIARPIGDVDGDGIADIVTSAPTRAIGGAASGRIYVYSTATGALIWSADGQPGDRLGIGVEGAGDTNHDGVPDVIASAPGGGYAKVFSGKDGRVLLTLHAEQPKDLFGRHVAGVGDVDHDGYADVIVGAPANNAGGQGAGRAYVYSGKDGRVLLTLTGERAGDAFGSAVAGSADPGSTLLLVGAPGAGAQHHGRTYIYTSLSAAPKWVIDADDTGAALGAMFLSVPGDVDGDGVPDVYASDFSNNAKGSSTGRVVVHSGRDGRHLLTLTGDTAGEGFGTSPSVAGDVDGDGHADLIVGAWQYSGAAASGGRAYLYSGRDGHLIKRFTCRIPGDTFGFDAVDVGDVDHDGTIDLLITSAWSGVHGFHSGRVFVISSGVPRTAVSGQAAVR